LRGTIEEFAYYSDEPSSDAGALPVWFLSKMSRTEVTVALSGEGADELFGGYLTYRADELARTMRRLPKWLVRGGLGAARMLPVSDDKISGEYMIKRFLAGSLMAPEYAHVYWNGTFSADEVRALSAMAFPSSLDRVLGELRDAAAKSGGVSSFLWWDQKYFLPDDILNKVDRMSMAHSLEVRPPFLDHRIVEFAATLPAAFKIQGSRQKILLKEMMKDRLPEAILARKKVGFDIPAHEWLRGPLRELLMDTVRSGLAEHKTLFRPGMIQELVRLHLERRVNVGYHLWGLLLLFLWMKKWRIQTASTPAPISWKQEKTGISA
jgi:asparagine synthase (glutamine-hydrolysing)